MTGVGVLGAWRRWRVWAYETQGQQRALAPEEEILLASVNSFRANKAGISEERNSSGAYRMQDRQSSQTFRSSSLSCEECMTLG